MTALGSLVLAGLGATCNAALEDITQGHIHARSLRPSGRQVQQHLHWRADAVPLFPVEGENAPANPLVKVTSVCLGQRKTEVADPPCN